MIIVLCCTKLLMNACPTRGENQGVGSSDTEWGQAIVQPRRDAVRHSEQELPVETEEVEIAVIGGGLIGLAVAIGLQRHGIDCTVFERAPRLRSVSQGILGLHSNGIRALELIHQDIVPLLRQRGCERKTLLLTTVENGIVSKEEKHVDTDTDSRPGGLSVGITWHKMQQLLASLLPRNDGSADHSDAQLPNSNIVKTGHSLASFVEDPDGVTLYFENGHVVRAKAVLGCDGIFSVTRAQIMNGSTKDSPIYFGQLNWASIIETDRLPSHVRPPDNTVQYISYRSGSDDCSIDSDEPSYGETIDRAPLRWMSMINDAGSGYTFWQFRVTDPEMALSLSQNSGRGGLGLPGTKNMLERVLLQSYKLQKGGTTGGGDFVYDTVKEIPEEQIFERSIVGRSPATTWISEGGRVVLVGDAAHGMHPVIGQGANLGFEGAGVLIDAIAAHEADRDWKAALVQYEKTFKRRADIIQQYANYRGVNQAISDGQAHQLPADVQKEMSRWIAMNSDPNDIPKEALDILLSFDPCSQPGVSSLW